MTYISIIMPVYNGEHTIERSILSCIGQSEKDFELIIIDNGSNDNTKIVVNKFLNDKRINYISINKKGRSHARNIGLKRAKGKYIVFLDADDTLNKNILEKGISILNENPEYFGYASSIRYIYENISKTFIKTPNVKTKFLYLNNQYPINSIIFRNENIELFQVNLEHNEDWLFFLKNLKDKEVYLDESNIGGSVFIHKDNTMKNYSEMISSKLYVRYNYKELFPNNFRIFIDNMKLLSYYIFLYENQNNYDLSEGYIFEKKIIRFFKDLPIFNNAIRKILIKKIENNIY